MTDLAVTVFDRDGEIYADCEELDVVVTGATQAEALEAMSEQLVLYYASKSIGMIRAGENLRNKLLRVVFPPDSRIATTLPLPSDEAVSTRAAQLSTMLAEIRDELAAAEAYRTRTEPDKLPPARFKYTAKTDMLLTHYGDFPVTPPVKLQAGASVELWWYISDGQVAYHHARSRTIEHAINVLGGLEPATTWHATPNPALGGKVPNDLLDTDAGVETVRRALMLARDVSPIGGSK